MKNMKQLITNTIPLLSSLTGIGRYCYEISKYIDKHKIYDSTFHYGYNSKNLIHPTKNENIKYLKSIMVFIPLFKKIVKKMISYYFRLFGATYDLYWEPNFIPNRFIKSNKMVTSVHDFSFILHKDFHPKERIQYFEENFFQNIYRSDIIITGSEFSKQEILDRLDFKEENVRVIYHGVRHDVFKKIDDIKLNFDLPEKFIFSVGSIEPRKNLIGLLGAYNNLEDKIKKEYKLVIAGFKGWENKEIMQIIEKNKDFITYLGYISDEELAGVYNKASCFVYPSFYEGFGLPPLEAMACGTPVICSNVSSLPEVGGEAVVYCDPYSVEDIKNKIESVLLDENLQKELSLKGLEQAQKFTWEKSAQEHIKIFNELLETI